MADTVESAIESSSAISGPVNRSRLSAAIAWTRSSGVRFNGLGSRGAVKQAELALAAVAADPLARAADADFSGRGRLRQRPMLLNDALGQQPTLVQAERSVSVKLHPESSLGLGRLAAPSLQGGPDEPTSSGTTASASKIERRSSRIRGHCRVCLKAALARLIASRR
jgi:hypothetical protein